MKEKVSAEEITVVLRGGGGKLYMIVVTSVNRDADIH